MNEWEIRVRGRCFKVWAPTLVDAFETFCIDMEFYEVPKNCCEDDDSLGQAIDMMPANIPPGF